MSKYLLLCSLLLAFCSCGKSSATHKAKEVKKAEKSYANLANATPLSHDQLKIWMPDKLIGMKRTSYSIGSEGYINMASLKATYSTTDESKKIRLSLIDGADSLQAGFIGFVRRILARNFKHKNENSVKKTMKKDGIKAIVKYQKDNSRSSIKFLVKNRFLLTLEGTNEGINDLWEAIGQLDVEELGS